jgi:hypothetical protein
MENIICKIMKHRTASRKAWLWVLLLFVIGLSQTILAQPFVHPGGRHTLADLNRMKTNVLAGNHP